MKPQSRLFEESSGDFLDSQCVDCFLQGVYLHGHDHIEQYSERGALYTLGMELEVMIRITLLLTKTQSGSSKYITNFQR